MKVFRKYRRKSSCGSWLFSSKLYVHAFVVEVFFFLLVFFLNQWYIYSMKTIVGRGRKILSRLFRVISVSAASLVLQACYGIILPETIECEYGPPSSTSINGKVSANKPGNPVIPGIKVSIEGTEYWDYTNKDGDFSFWGVPIKDAYIVKFEDVDGLAQGGLFGEQIWTLKQEETYRTLLIRMDLVP